ncbi:uncharacterized protein TRAVEDRAFT_45551 [Trametes versicolor FP-101664 SS1]|uniref:uncharacterized protein n=1 Tax=Trametes versicolor (strain FP-101664) TaxID=717944 RepID=UPI000462377D|nr:uncharacterized protein TRAVEDRAFT_45551 [Trametes versicolor FP-101664 SS1]EIW60301.1 hypothetical protein TRAVEDRAFT_45551 [Trametes versicolor FP-101664 SS1]
MSMIMAESFDAPMTDSGDLDVSMYPGAADSWLSAEASMGDVAYPADTATFDYMQEGIEVEMLDDLDDDAAITEYEMADDGDGYYDQELEDVEVLDVSRGASIPPAGPTDVAGDAKAENPEMMHVPPYDGGAPVASGSHYPVEPIRDDSALYVETDSTAHPEHLAETDALAESSTTLRGDVHHAVSPSSPSVLDVSAVVRDNNSPGELPVLPTPNHAEDASTSTDPAALELHSPEDHLLEPVPSGPSDVDQASPAVPVDPVGLHPSEESAYELAADDPHEISDGVYIDPPPPVLLSLPPSAEYAEYCLFNQPQSDASPSTPEGSKSEHAAEPLRLLLHDRPTLYYEPLSSVFDALRHEECIENLPGSSDAELVLDAYELKLAICEDNVYAHEVTLHELDVIHGGSDLQGPLRLKLKFVAPRFVTRYHLLRDQISRLNLTADGDELLSGAPASDPVHEQQSGVSHDAEEVPHHYAEDGDARESVDEHHDGLIEGTEDGAHEELHEGVDGPEAEVLAPSFGSTDDHGASELPEAVPEQSVGEDGTAALEGLSREATAAPLDADEAEAADLEDEHEQDDDAEEGGDYVGHDEFPDDEDEFGDDLPEEIGGQTENAEYTHTGAVEDAPQDSAYVEVEGVDAHEDTLQSFSDDVGLGDPYAASGAQDDEDPQLLNDGLDTKEHTDTFSHLDSADNYDESHSQDDGTGQHDDESTAAHLDHAEHSQNYDDDPLANEESTTLSSEEEDGLADDWDDGDDVLDVDAVPAPSVDQADALSRKSSSATLASKSSKRTYDEVELDDFDDDPSQLEIASTPDAKRPRVQ